MSFVRRDCASGTSLKSVLQRLRAAVLACSTGWIVRTYVWKRALFPLQDLLSFSWCVAINCCSSFLSGCESFQVLSAVASARLASLEIVLTLGCACSLSCVGVVCFGMRFCVGPRLENMQVDRLTQEHREVQQVLHQQIRR